MNQTTGSLWVVYALLSALFAALTSILAKIGINGVDSNLATAIRTVVVLVMAWGLVFMTGVQKQISNIGARSWLFLVLSGIATGLSWLFYYQALQMGDASRVVPIDKSSVVISMVLAFVVLKEQLTWQSIVGGLLITAGTFVLIDPVLPQRKGYIHCDMRFRILPYWRCGLQQRWFFRFPHLPESKPDLLSERQLPAVCRSFWKIFFPAPCVEAVKTDSQMSVAS